LPSFPTRRSSDLIWWTIAGIIAAAIGGWIAGRTLGSADRSDGMIHGLLSWAGATLVIAFLLTTAAGGILGAGMQQQAMGPLGEITGQAGGAPQQQQQQPGQQQPPAQQQVEQAADRKSTRLNSSHVKISYAVFCLKKKK